MKIITVDDMFEVEKADVYIVTTNSYVKDNGELAMGRGAALRANQLYPGIAESAAKLMKNLCPHLGRYGYLQIYINLKAIGLFQVKCHFKNQASLALIEYSIERMIFYLVLAYGSTFLDRKFVMNYPGIGYGGLSEEEVLPLIEKLTDNFVICKQS